MTAMEQTEKLYSGRFETSAVGIIQILLVKQDTLQTIKEHFLVRPILCAIGWSRTVVKFEVQTSPNHLPTLVECHCLVIQDDWRSISALKCYWELWEWPTRTNLICNVSKDNKFVTWWNKISSRQRRILNKNGGHFIFFQTKMGI